MRPLRILIIEDEAEWQDLLEDRLQELAAEVEFAGDSVQAESKLNDQAFDLVTVDLDLWGDQTGGASLSATIGLLRKIRQSGLNRFAAVVIVTGHREPENFSEILRLRLAQDYFYKRDGLDPGMFLAGIRQALLASRADRASAETAEAIILTLRSGDQEWLGCSLSGSRRADESFDHPLGFSGKEWSEQGYLIGEGLVSELEIMSSAAKISMLGRLWRPIARAAGRAIYEDLKRHPLISEFITSASVQVPNNRLSFQFLGPATSLEIPFELLHDGEDSLNCRHPIVRRISGLKADFRRPTLALSELLNSIKSCGRAFRFLIVGVHASSAPLAYVQAEIDLVEGLVRSEVENHLGIRVDIVVLEGSAASVQRVRRVISEGVDFFHYAGHGAFDISLPERSGIVLHQGGSLKVLTAADLKDLVLDGSLRFCFLNCCLSARTASGAGRGDFLGMSQALLAGGVPTVLGHRWEVLDRSAIEFARSYYSCLWRSLRFEDALLDARNEVAHSTYGRDDPAWASPVLIDQTFGP